MNNEDGLFGRSGENKLAALGFKGIEYLRRAKLLLLTNILGLTAVFLGGYAHLFYLYCSINLIQRSL